MLQPSRNRRLTDEQVLVIFDMWESGSTRAEIAYAMDLTVYTLDERRKDQLSHLPKRQGRREHGNGFGDNPTPEQIAEIENRKLQVQARWTEQERVLRIQGIPDNTQRVREIAAAYRQR